jgi:hypothetical protein
MDMNGIFYVLVADRPVTGETVGSEFILTEKLYPHQKRFVHQTRLYKVFHHWNFCSNRAIMFSALKTFRMTQP